MPRYFKVKNFERFQHYKDRNPVWIKLYNELLDDYEFGQLSDASKWHLCAIWLLASRYQNRIPLDSKWIQGRINATEKVDLGLLEKTGFIEEIPEETQGCSNALAEPYQVAMPETEKEGEKEKENTRATRFVPPTVEQVSSYVKESGLKVDAEAFVDYFTSNGWKVGGKAPMKSWESAARTWDRRQRSNGSSDSSVPYV
jgi:hypothetical protein